MLFLGFSRSRLFPIASLFAAVGLLVLGGGGAMAQFAGNTAFTNTTSVTQTITTQTVTQQTDTYVTEIIGKLNAGTVFDQTFNVAFADPAVQAAVASARVAITTAGGPAVVISGPTLVSHNVTLLSSTSSTTSVVQSQTTANSVQATLGPGVVPVGDLGICANVGAANAYPTGCSKPGTLLTVAPGQEVFNVNVNTDQKILQTTTTTNTVQTAEVYQLTGTTQAIGTVHTAVQSGAFDMASRFLRRMGDEGDIEDSGETGSSARPLGFASDSGRYDNVPPELLAYNKAPAFKALPNFAPAADEPRYRGWAEGYGLWSRTSAQGPIPGDDRRMYGLAGGFGVKVSPGVTLGFGVDQGWSNIDLGAVSESARINLTQFGVNAGLRSGPWLANLAAIYGTGNADPSHGNAALGGVSTSSYGVSIWGVLAEAGYRLRYGEWRVVPKAGFDWTRVQTGAFTEIGGLALMANNYAADRTRGFVGVEVGRRWPVNTAMLDISAYVRAVDVLSGRDRLLPVAFVALPGVPLTITGTREGQYGADAGARATLDITPKVKLYAAYDGRFRDGFEAHAITGGVLAKW
jgi:uncharacterized protein with beta-barrel porin domain